MAADAASMRTVLQRLGCSNEAATAIVDAEGYDSLEDFRIASDEDLDNLMTNVRRPGGTVTNDNDEEVRNPGQSISSKAELNIRLLSFYLQVQENCDTAVAFANLDDNGIRDMRANFKTLMLQEDKYKEPDVFTSEEVMNFKDMPKTMDTLRDHLSNFRGVTGIPLDYVVRPEVAPADEPEDGWPSKLVEMSMRAKIVVGGNGADKDNKVETFKTDSMRVWGILSKICQPTQAWTYCKAGKASKCGRKAWLAMYDHYLGECNVDNQAARAESSIRNATYNGKQRRFSMEKYISIHKDNHYILESLKNHGYVGMDDRTKVRHFMNGIKTKDLDAVKMTINANAELRSNFDKCSQLFKDAVEQMQADHTPSVNISKVETTRDHRKNKKHSGKRSNGQVEDRFYSKEEYARLSADDRAKLHELRKNRGHYKNKKAKKSDDERSIKAMVTEAIAQARAEGNNTSSGGSGDGNSTPRTGNLTRQPSAARRGGDSRNDD